VLLAPPPFDPTIKLTHDQLSVLPDDQQMQYFDAHRGVFEVMGEMGFALTDEKTSMIGTVLNQNDVRYWLR
jgi:hypothetical protein